jgi:excinuclease ABC subunit C
MISQSREKIKERIKKLPDAPGVYFFLDSKGKILYIGKATSLCDRTKSYFSKDIMSTRGPLIAKMIDEISDIKHTQTDSVLEALILEAALIKKHQPYYNSREKDDKSHNYVVLTKENFPKLLVVRGKNLETIPEKSLMTAGPFPHGGELREALKIIRRIFPYRDEKCKIAPAGKPLKPCFPAQLGLCPGPCAGRIGKKEYRKTIKHLILFFEGKKDTLVRELEKEMKSLAKEQKFEEAEKIKRQIYALDHIQDVALIKREIETDKNIHAFRIEAYDVAHLGGKDTVGVMVVAEDGELDKSQYRKFRIRGSKGKVAIDDTNNLKEVITRRLGHLEWELPNLIVVDGGVAQINAAKEVLKEKNFNIEIVSVVKDEKHKAREIMGSKGIIEKHNRTILLVNTEAHRFAIGYHRKLRSKGFRI